MFLTAVSLAAPCESLDLSTGKGNLDRTYSFYGRTAEVEVDPESEHVDVFNMWTACDEGRELNHMLLRGRIIGSAVIHLGLTLFEGIIRDAKDQTLSTWF